MQIKVAQIKLGDFIHLFALKKKTNVTSLKEFYCFPPIFVHFILIFKKLRIRTNDEQFVLCCTYHGYYWFVVYTDTI